MRRGPISLRKLCTNSSQAGSSTASRPEAQHRLCPARTLLTVASTPPRRPPARMRPPVRHRAKLVFPVVTRITVKTRRPQIRIVRFALVAVIVKPGRPAPGRIQFKLHQIPRIVRQAAAVTVQPITVSPRPGITITKRPTHRRFGPTRRYLRIGTARPCRGSQHHRLTA